MTIKEQLTRVLATQSHILDSLAKLSDISLPHQALTCFSVHRRFLTSSLPMQSTGGATQTGLGNATIPSLVNKLLCPSQVLLSQPTFQVMPHVSVEEDQTSPVLNMPTSASIALPFPPAPQTDPQVGKQSET